MTFGDPLGKGKPYYSQILYPYLLTLTHRVAGVNGRQPRETRRGY